MYAGVLLSTMELISLVVHVMLMVSCVAVRVEVGDMLIGFCPGWERCCIDGRCKSHKADTQELLWGPTCWHGLH